MLTNDSSSLMRYNMHICSAHTTKLNLELTERQIQFLPKYLNKCTLTNLDCYYILHLHCTWSYSRCFICSCSECFSWISPHPLKDINTLHAVFFPCCLTWHVAFTAFTQTRSGWGGAINTVRTHLSVRGSQVNSTISVCLGRETLQYVQNPFSY